MKVEDVLQETEQSCLQNVVKSVVGQAVPCSPQRCTVEIRQHTMECPWWRSLFLKDWALQKKPMLEQFQELQPVGGMRVGEVLERLPPMGRTPHWSRGRVWGVFPLRRKEQQRQHVMKWLSPQSQLPFSRGRGREFGSWTWEEGQVGQRCIEIWFYFCLSQSNSVYCQTSQFPQPTSVLPVAVINELWLRILIATHKTFIVFFPQST